MTLAWGKYWDAVSRNKFLNFLIGRTVAYKTAPGYKPEITVLIAAYNEELSLENTIRSIQTQSYAPKKIIVVDDCSTDRTSEIAESMNVITLRTPKNGGKADGLNYALVETGLVDTELFLTLDGDTILDHKALENLVPAMADPKMFSACGFVIPQVINTFWETARFGQYLYLIGLNKQAQNNVGVTLVSSGCFALYNTALVVKLGGFPAEAIIEDIPLTWKAHIEGYNVSLMPSAICYPIDPPTWKIYDAQCSRWQSAILQSISLYNTKLLKKKRLAFFICWYVLLGLLMPVAYFPVIGYVAYALATGAYVPTPLLLWLGFDLSMTFVYIMYGGIKYQGVKKSFKAWLFYWMIAPIDGYIFLKTIWNEWILGKRLVVWHKGH